MERIYPRYIERIMSAKQAARLITSDMTLGFSGFTLTGYPKAIPAALADSGHAKRLTLCTGASIGDNADGLLARAGLLRCRFPYQSNEDLRRRINDGSVGYADMHLSHFPLLIRRGVGQHINIAVIECTAITEQGLIPSVSVGASDAFAQMADKVIVEINEALPLGLCGMHDIFDIGIPPETKPIPIISVSQRIGTPYIPCPPEKIAAIVLTNEWDQPAKFKAPDAVSEIIGENVVRFLQEEVRAGRLPDKLGPIQSGVGSVANAVLNSLARRGFRDLEMYTETFQSSALDLLDSGVFRIASTSSVSLSRESQERFLRNIEAYRDRIIIRPQEITNHPEVIRRLGLVSLNTPVEVDIYGNVNSTHQMGSKILNGIGGSGDFSRNACVSIFATESTAKGGAVSCIVPMVSHVDHTEHDTQIIITEQGIADLRCKTPRERAELLIENCAHPDYRSLLRQYVEDADRFGYGKQTPHDLSKALSWHIRYMEAGSMRD